MEKIGKVKFNYKEQALKWFDNGKYNEDKAYDRQKTICDYVLTLNKIQICHILSNIKDNKYDIQKYNNRDNIIRDRSLTKDEIAILCLILDSLKYHVIPKIDNIYKDAKNYFHDIRTLLKEGISYNINEEDLKELLGYSLYKSYRNTQEKCKRIINKYSPNDIILKDDMKWLIENRFKYHYSWNNIIKDKTIKNISVVRTEYNNNCFRLNFTDGTTSLISYISGYDTQYKIMKDQILLAIREADYPRRIRFKNEFLNTVRFPYNIDVDGENITVNKNDELHVDHYNNDFSIAASEWINQFNSLEYIWNNIKKHEKLLPNGSYETKYIFSSPELEKSAADYIKNHTHLRLITKESNLSRKKQLTFITIKTDEDTPFNEDEYLDFNDYIIFNDDKIRLDL